MKPLILLGLLTLLIAGCSTSPTAPPRNMDDLTPCTFTADNANSGVISCPSGVAAMALEAVAL